jgi:hypothetical protein
METKEKRISYSTAKLAKKIGFSELCTTAYNDKGEVRENIDARNWNRHIFKFTESGEKKAHYTERPTQSMLRDYLWKTHKIWIEVTLHENYFHGSVKQIMRNKTIIITEPIYFDQNPYNVMEEILKDSLAYVISQQNTVIKGKEIRKTIVVKEIKKKTNKKQKESFFESWDKVIKNIKL